MLVSRLFICFEIEYLFWHPYESTSAIGSSYLVNGCLFQFYLKMGSGPSVRNLYSFHLIAFYVWYFILPMFNILSSTLTLKFSRTQGSVLESNQFSEFPHSLKFLRTASFSFGWRKLNFKC